MEEDVSNYWRTLYKLEKGFCEDPNALNMATTIKAKIEEFKEHIPMVQVDGVFFYKYIFIYKNSDFDMNKLKFYI